MPSCAYFYDFLKRFDYFGIRPSLFFRGKNIKGTGFGSFLTFMLLAITISCFIYFGQNLYNRKNPSINYHEEYVEEPEAIVINPEQFPILIELNDPFATTFFTSPNFILAQVSQISRIGSEAMQITNYNMEVCNESHIEFLEPNYQEYFNSKNLSNFFCIPKELKNLTIEGAFDRKVFRTIKISFSICQQQDICNDLTEIQNKMNKGFIGIYFLDAAVDPANYTNPKKIIPREVFTNFVLSSQKEIDINFMNNYLISDQGVLFEEEIDYTIFNYDDYQEMNFMEYNAEFLQVYLKIKQLKMVYQRSYSKIQDVLGLLGGFLNFFLLLGWLLNFLYVRLVLITDILLDIFTVKISEKKEIISASRTTNQQIVSPLNQMPSENRRLNSDYPERRNIYERNCENKRNLESLDNIIRSNNNELCKSMEIPNFTMNFPHIYRNNSEILIKKPQEIELNSLEIKKNDDQQEENPFKLLRTPPNLKKLNKEAFRQIDNPEEIKPVEISRRNFLNLNKNKKNQQINSIFSDNVPHKLSIFEPEADFKEIKEIDKIELSVFDYIFIYSGLFRTPEREKKKLIINKGLEIMRKCLDVKFIIQKFYEIEKLKQLLLTESQIDLFKFLPKPEIILNVEEINGKKQHSINTKVLMRDHSMEDKKATTKERMSALMQVSKRKRNVGMVDRKLTRFTGGD